METIVDGVKYLHSLVEVEEKLATIEGKEKELTDYFTDGEKTKVYLQEKAKLFFMEKAQLSKEQAQALAETDPVNNKLAVKVEACLQTYGSPEAIPAEVRKSIGKEYLVDLIISAIPKGKMAVAELLANCKISADDILVNKPSVGGMNSFSINSKQLEKRISAIDFMITLSKSDGKNHPPSAHPSTIAGMVVATPDALVKGAWNGASYIASGQVIFDFGSLAKLLASGQETASGLGKKIVSSIGESFGNFLDKVKDAGDDHLKRGITVGDAGGQLVGEVLGSAAATKTIWIVAKGTVKVAAGTKVAHAAGLLSKKAQQLLGNLNTLENLDKTAAQLIRARGGKARNVRELKGGVENLTLKEIAIAAAQGSSNAIDALKIIKDARRLGQKY